ncbi:uncharacterized protein LOC113855692 [Abrus precatorius]|uniref:Uncharacterized protein LOC113855692 n=1 Tax=Abrus precatorius TaxID=3816 RepID=A0A8B8KJT6_ABRPR|nr:uncharacterized protein LOC113855692 [Abrus precatorius]
MSIFRNTRKIELVGLDKVNYLFTLSTASLMLLENLRIDACSGLKHIIDFGDDCDGRNSDVIFPNLKAFSVYNCGQLEYMFDQYLLHHQKYTKIHIDFPALETLRLYELPIFISICRQNSLSVTLPSLKELYVNGCPLFALTSLNDLMVDSDTRQLDHEKAKASSSECVQTSEIARSLSRHSQCLLNIRYMELKNCPKVISFFTFSITSTMLLESLRIDSCDGLKHLEYVIGPNHHEDDGRNLEFHTDFPVLEELTLIRLSKIINICPTSYVVSLPSLKKFELDTCPQYNSVTDSMMSLYSRQLHSTTNKASSSECVQTSEIARSLSRHSQRLLNIRYMELKNCPKVISLFTFSITSTMLLESLRIDSCDGLKHVITSMRHDEDRKNCNSIFPKLKEISIRGCDQLEYVIGPNHHEDDGRNLEFHTDFPALEELTLIRLSKIINICPTSYVVSLPSLKKFELDTCPQYNSVTDSMMSLYSRQLHSTTNKASSSECVQTSEIARSLSRHSQRLLNIRYMELKNCPKVISLFTFSITSTMLLESLRIDSCDGLKHVITSMRHDEDRKNCNSIFPKLKEISIRGCDQLEYVIGPNHHEDDGRNLEFHTDFPALEELTLVRLSKIINICPTSYVVSLPSLKKFELDTCPQYNSVTDSMMSLYSRQLHSTTNKPSSSECVQTSEIARSLSRHSQRLLNIRYMELKNCPKVISLFTFSITSTMLLESLRIDSCDGLKHVITSMRHDEDRKNCTSIFPKLKEISIRGCDQLEYVIGPNHHEDDGRNLEFHTDFPALEELTLIRLSKIINICPTSYVVSLPSLKKFELDTCPQYNSVTDSMMSLYSRQLHSTTNKASSSECVQTSEIARSLSRHSQRLLNIRYMELKNCPKVISLFTFSITSTMLLESLRIDSCDGLKHVITSMRHDEDRKNCNSIFPKLKEISIRGCDQLEYVIGPNHHEDDGRNLEFHTDFPALEELTLIRLSKIINICPTSYVVSLPSLKKFELDTCPQYNSVTDSMMSLYSRQLHSTTNKPSSSECVQTSEIARSLSRHSQRLLNILSKSDIIVHFFYYFNNVAGEFED